MGGDGFMIGVVIVAYLVAGLYFVGVVSIGPADNLKDEDHILYLKVVIYILLLWPVCLFEAWRDHGNDDEEDTDL